jgi:MFS family permease
MERFLDFQIKREIKLVPLFLNNSFRSVAVSLMTLFSSIYIYKTLLGLTGQEKTALFSVAIYFLGIYGFKFISNLFAEELSLRMGLKKQIYFGLLFSVVSLCFLFLSLKWPFGLFLASPFWGLSTGFYWFGCHGMMVKLGDGAAFGKELGILGSISTFFLLAVPFLGGVLIGWAGYQALFIAALIFIVLSSLSLWSMKEERTRHDTCMTEVFQLFKAHRRAFLAYVGDTIGTTIYTIIIPLYLFLILGKELSLGEFFSLSMVVVAVINLLVGRWVDVRGKQGLIVYGSIFQVLVWTGRILTKGIGIWLTLDIFDRVTGGMVGIPMNVISYEKAIEDHSTGRAVLFREQAITIGGILTCGLLLIWALLGIDLKWIFVVGALSSLLPILMIRTKNEKPEK